MKRPQLSPVLTSRALASVFVSVALAKGDADCRDSPVHFETHPEAPVRIQIDPELGRDRIVKQRKRRVGEQKLAPRTLVSGRKCEARIRVERLIKIRIPEDRGAPDVERHVAEDDPVLGVDTDGSGAQMVVGLGVVARREDAILHQVAGAHRGERFAGEEEGMELAPHFRGVEDLRFQVVESPLRGEELPVPVDPHIAHQQHVPRIRVVLRVVAVDRRLRVADDDALLGDGEAPFHAGGLRGDLDRDIAKAAKLGPRDGHTQKREREQKEQSFHAGSRSYRTPWKVAK